MQGLKIKHIRQLCLEQLKGMTEEDIAESLEDTQTSVESLNVDATVLKFLGSEATGEDGELNHYYNMRPQLYMYCCYVSSAVYAYVCWCYIYNVHVHVRVLNCTHVYWCAMLPKGVRRDEAERGKDHRGDTATKIDLDGGGDLEKNRGSLLVCEEKQQQSVVCVSDVSEDEGTVASSTVDVASQEGPLTRSSPTLTMECDTTTTELSTDPHTRSEREEGLSEREGEGLSDRDEERPSEREGEGEIDSEDGTSTGSDSSLSDLEDCWLCDFPDEVSEMARLREIEFRQRALEAELRRRGETVDTHTGDGDRGKKEEGEEGERVSVCDGGERDGVSDTFSQDATAKLDKSKAIEMQLRQRALQSLLAKKKQQNL